MRHQLRFIVKLLVLGTFSVIAGNAGASDTKINLAKHKLSSAVASGEIPPQVTGPLFGYYPTRWRAMPSDTAILGDVLPVPPEAIDGTRFVPPIPVEGGPLPRTVPGDSPALTTIKPQVSTAPKIAFGENR